MSTNNDTSNVHTIRDLLRQAREQVEALPVEAPPQTWSQAKAALLAAMELLTGALREAEGLAPSDTTDTLTARITQARASLFVVTAQEPPVSWNAFRDMLWGIEALVRQAEDLTRKPHHHRLAA